MPRNKIRACDAKTHFFAVLQRVEHGEEVTITRHGSAVARLIPVKRSSTPAQRRTAIQAMRRLAISNSLGRLRIKDLVNEGRR